MLWIDFAGFFKLIPTYILRFSGFDFCREYLFLLTCLNAIQKREYCSCHQLGASEILQLLSQVLHKTPPC